MGDVRKASPKLPIGIAALRPRNRVSPQFERAVKIFKALKVPLLAEDELVDWTEKHLPADLPVSPH